MCVLFLELPFCFLSGKLPPQASLSDFGAKTPIADFPIGRKIVSTCNPFIGKVPYSLSFPISYNEKVFIIFTFFFSISLKHFLISI